ncbi:MAG: MFS transporter [Candidatus Methanofastidiosia archaeon]
MREKTTKLFKNLYLRDVMNLSGYEKNIKYFYLYKTLLNFSLWMPIWVLFLLQKGLSYTQITLMDIAFFATIALAEIPTGAVADLFGRKRSILFGVLLRSFAIFVFGISKTYPLILVSYFLWAISITLESGADSAFLYDTLKVLGREGEFKRIMGKSVSLVLLSLGVASVLGGFLGEFDLRIPIFLASAIGFLSSFAVLRFKEPMGERRKMDYLRHIRESVRFISEKSQIKKLMLFYVMLLVGVSIAKVFAQPTLREIGISVSFIGISYLFFTFTSAFGSNYSYKIEPILGRRVSLLSLPIISILAIFAIFTFQKELVLTSYLLLYLISGFAQPVIEDYLNVLISSKRRATILSIMGMLFSILITPTEIGFGILADSLGLQKSFFILGVGFALSMSSILVFQRRKDKLISSD